MKVSKRSLHYRFLQRMNGTPPTDLCRYMRNLVGFLFLCGVILPIIVTGMISFPLVMYFGKDALHVFIADVGVVTRIFIIVTIALGGLAWLAVALLTVFFTCDKIRAWRQYEPDSLLSVWLRAKKEKICPIIEFTE